jgi:uncharacterized membrane protein YhaH (DUF805 family)
LFSPVGRLDRRVFLVTTIILAAIKISADYVLARVIFHQPWSPTEYVWSRSLLFRLTDKHSIEFIFTKLCLAAPFAWIGASLCAKRLRSAGAPVWLVVFFFVPIAKWFLFAILAALPPRSVAETAVHEVPPGAGFRWLPRSAAGSAVVAVVITTIVNTAIVLCATRIFGGYNSTLFLGTPFFAGFLATLLHGARIRRTLGQSIAPALLSLLFIAAILLAVAAEGVICLIMAAPLAFCETVAGAFVAHGLLQSLHRSPGPALSSVVVLPVLFFTESVAPPAPLVRTITSEITVNATPQRVWTEVISFPHIAPPGEWIFRAGIAYPESARIDGFGVGAIRHCIFSTGEFVEPITTWDPPNRLAFDVSAQPDALRELSPYRDLRTPHLHGYFQSTHGEFTLWPAPGGRTRLQGATWYTLKFGPETYWQWWSDYLIHRIHLRVLQHIKAQVENSG